VNSTFGGIKAATQREQVAGRVADRVARPAYRTAAPADRAYGCLHLFRR